jgi:hypothetical protein
MVVFITLQCLLKLNLWRRKTMGKGSAPRPFSVANEEYAARWDMIFGRDTKEKEEVISEVDINDWDKESQEAYLKWAKDYGLNYEPWLGKPDVAAAWEAAVKWVVSKYDPTN